MDTAAPHRTPAALLLPGQGSQSAGMRELVERHESRLAELALEAVGADPFALAEEGTADAQPAILCASIAGRRFLAINTGTRMRPDGTLAGSGTVRE